MKVYEPGASMHTYEICARLSENEVDRIIRKWEKKNETIRRKKDSVENYLFAKRGVSPKLYNNGWLYVKVNPVKLINSQCGAAEIIEPNKKKLEDSVKILEQALTKLSLPSQFEQYVVSRADLCVNLVAKKNSEVREYLRLQKKRKPADGLEERRFFDKRLDATDNLISGHSYYCLASSANKSGEVIVFYDKNQQAHRKGLYGADDLPKGLLRIERQLDRAHLYAVQRDKHLSNAKLLCYLARNSGELILEKLENCFDKGIFLKKYEIMKCIDKSAWSDKTKMLAKAYVKQAKEYGEELAAQRIMRKQSWSKEQYRRFRKRFVKLGIQPVPLRKNFKKNRLQSPEELLAELLADS